MFPVRRRQVQERGWSYRVQQLPGGLELTRTEYGFGQLHVQRWLFWAEWRDMRGVRFRQVQERGWIYRVQQLPGELELACAEHGFGRLHLQGWLVGA
jgi:hypothetical protein